MAQVASVMEVLANAAVAEICRLVDKHVDNLHNRLSIDRENEIITQISQSQKENRSLRRKLQLLELKTARERAERTMRERAERTMRERTLANRPNITTVKGDVPRASVWKDEARLSNPSQGIITIEETADADDSGSSLVKQGRSDSEEGQLQATAPPSATEDLAAPPAWTRRCVTEVSGMDAVLKTETQTETLPLTHRVQQRAEAERLGRVNPNPDAEYLCYQTASPSALSRRAGEALEFGDQASCSERHTEGLGAAEEVTVKVEADAPLMSWGAETRVRDGGDLLDYRECLEMSCSDLTTHSPLRALTRDQNSASRTVEVRDHGGLLDPIFTSGDRASDQCHVTRAAGDTGCKEKRFRCTLCGKGFSCPKKVEIHQRVHTGEKPFSCAHCRMSFAQSGNLKRHQRVHTGEKPFSCTQCEKRFSHLHQLKMHMKVHTGERPFVCSACGKRFAERSYLKIHQQKHHPI